jgi:hypothetical protein
VQLKYQDLLAVKSTGMLPVFAYALLAALAIGLSVGGYGGWRLHKGATAIKENAQLRSDLADVLKAAKELRESAVANDINYAEAIKRMDKIADQRERDREENRKREEDQRTALAQLLELRPDLRNGRAGDDVLRHWRKSNSRPGAEPAPTAPAGKPAPAVPGPAATGGRPVGEPDRQPRRGGGALSRLPERQRAPDPGRARVAEHGVGLVLRSGRQAGHQGTGLWV